MKNLRKNIVYQISYEVLILVIPFITSPYLARVVGPEGLGKFSYSYTMASYFLLFADLGIKNYGNRLIAQSRDNNNNLKRNFSSLVLLRIILGGLVTILYLLYIHFIAQDNMYLLIQSFIVISSIFDISWFYFGLEKFQITIIRNLIIKIATVISIFMLVKAETDLWLYCLIMALGTLISQMILWIPLKNYVHFQFPAKSEVLLHIKPLVILFIPAIAVSLYKFMDKIMIAEFSSNIQLGYFDNAEKISNIPVTIISAFGVVMLPKMSNLVKSSENTLNNIYIEKSIDAVMFIAAALSFGLASVGQTFAPVFWGEAFTPSGKLIMGLSFALPFISFANIIRTQYLIPNEKDKEYVISVSVGALINILLNIIFIPKFGALGAVYGTLSAEFTVCFLQVFFVRNYLPIRNYIKITLPYLFYGFVMFLFVNRIPPLFFSGLILLFIQIIIGGIIYICLVYIHSKLTNKKLFFVK